MDRAGKGQFDQSFGYKIELKLVPARLPHFSRDIRKYAFSSPPSAIFLLSSLGRERHGSFVVAAQRGGCCVMRYLQRISRKKGCCCCRCCCFCCVLTAVVLSLSAGSSLRRPPPPPIHLLLHVHIFTLSSLVRPTNATCQPL